MKGSTARWLINLSLIYSVMIIWWWDVLVAMISEQRFPDLSLFVLLGFVSGSAGLLLVIVLRRLHILPKGRIISALLAFLISLGVLYVVTRVLVVLITVT